MCFTTLEVLPPVFVVSRFHVWNSVNHAVEKLVSEMRWRLHMNDAEPSFNFWHRLHRWYITMEVPSMNLQHDKTHLWSSASIVKHPPVLHSWVDSLKSWYTSFLYWLWVQCGEIILLFCVTGEVAGRCKPCRCKETYMGTKGLIGNTAIPKLEIHCYRSKPKFASTFVL